MLGALMVLRGFVYFASRASDNRQLKHELFLPSYNFSFHSHCHMHYEDRRASGSEFFFSGHSCGTTNSRRVQSVRVINDHRICLNILNMIPILVFHLFGIFLIVGRTIVGQDFDCRVNETAVQLDKSLSRKKRYLAFPTGSSFVSTLTLLKAIQLKEPSNWNLDLEFDVIWPIPNQESLHRRKPHKHVKSLHRTRRHKRDFYANIELALMSQGLPGKECLLRTICEASDYLNLPGVSFVDDILRVILSHDDREHNLDRYDVAYRKKSNCEQEYPCPISILNLLFNFKPQSFV